MIDANDIRKALKNEYSEDKTQQDISDASGVGRSYISQLLSGKRKIDGLSLKKINQLFPDCALHLYGDKATIQLTAAERKLLDLFRQMTEEGQLETLLQVAAILPQYKSQTRSA